MKLKRKSVYENKVKHSSTIVKRITISTNIFEKK